MDPLQLLADLEALRDKIPAALSADFENLIVAIRNIYEISIKFVTPPEPVHAGKNNLASHHATISDLCVQLENRLPAFRQVYIGKGSDAYYTTATASLQNLQLIRTHFETAAFLHNVMATNFELATEAKIALVALLVGLAITLTVLIASAGATAPVTVPAAAAETAGGLVSIGIMTQAEAAALAAIMGLDWAGLPVLISALAAMGVVEALGHTILHSQSGDGSNNSSNAGDNSNSKAGGTNQTVPSDATQAADYAASHNGQAQPGYVGDRPFVNDGRDSGQVLPKTTEDGTPITYKEYDVHPYTRGVNRGQERIVIGSDGSRYYTPDHYNTFKPF